MSPFISHLVVQVRARRSFGIRATGDVYDYPGRQELPAASNKVAWATNKVFML